MYENWHNVTLITRQTLLAHYKKGLKEIKMLKYFCTIRMLTSYSFLQLCIRFFEQIILLVLWCLLQYICTVLFSYYDLITLTWNREENDSGTEAVQRFKEILERIVEKIRKFIDEGKVIRDDVFDKLVERVSDEII